MLLNIFLIFLILFCITVLMVKSSDGTESLLWRVVFIINVLISITTLIFLKIYFVVWVVLLAYKSITGC